MNKSRKIVNVSTMTTYQAGIAQSMMHRNIQKVSNDILKPYTITKMQWTIIGAVLDSGKEGMRMSDLAKAIGVTIPYMTNTLQTLEAKEFVYSKWSDQDKRSRIVFMNDKKIDQCKLIEENLRAGLREAIYKYVDPDEFQTYMKVVLELKDIDINK